MKLTPNGFAQYTQQMTDQAGHLANTVAEAGQTLLTAKTEQWNADTIRQQVGRLHDPLVSNDPASFSEEISAVIATMLNDPTFAKAPHGQTPGVELGMQLNRMRVDFENLQELSEADALARFTAANPTVDLTGLSSEQRSELAKVVRGSLWVAIEAAFHSLAPIYSDLFAGEDVTVVAKELAQIFPDLLNLAFGVELPQEIKNQPSPDP